MKLFDDVICFRENGVATLAWCKWLSLKLARERSLGAKNQAGHVAAFGVVMICPRPDGMGGRGR